MLPAPNPDSARAVGTAAGRDRVRWKMVAKEIYIPLTPAASRGLPLEPVLSAAKGQG